MSATFSHGEARFVVVSLSLSDDASMEKLTPAERAVAALAASGWSNQAIARCRGKALRTIANQMASILKKQRVGSRYELAARLALCPLAEES
jgi:DNA-binding NarL/FixJ family response regulator